MTEFSAPTRLPDGAYLSMLGTLRVRVIECEITIATPAGRRTGVYRLATTLLDHRRYPAVELITLYHQPREIKTAYPGSAADVEPGHGMWDLSWGNA